MTPQPISRRVAALRAATPVLEFLLASPQVQRQNEPEVANFLFGNPQEMPLPGFVEALQRWSVPQDKDWFAYKHNDPKAQAVVAEVLRERRGVAFEPEDIFLTNGAFGALAVALGAVVDAGDEVIFITPPWFFYEPLIVGAGGVPVRVKIDPATFDLDVDAIAAACTPRTRAIIVNSPNNPTGKLYSRETLQRLGAVLAEASRRNGRPIYLLSDEAYSRILFDGRAYISPTEFYSHAFLLYTYGKTLLTPGQRLGYIAIPPAMPDRDAVREAVALSQLVTSYAVANALLQHALADIEALSIDIAHLQARRDRMVAALRDIGYQAHVPEGTFYLLPQSPWADDRAFADLLLAHDILVLPGTWVEMPGYFRISLTANDAMIERSLAGFAAAREHAIRHEAVASGSPD
ncbi:MAG: aminotransferase class I/II-fold pyridoxal phosphate-dependent enzyme [Ktedonobacterales bacterium]|jgi:aspartate aminotransferase|nr:MAG: aminotransferase class I/II-fold pyridoxal phosphate-dependent enzyme [Ktedonobacterales bacterium]